MRNVMPICFNIVGLVSLVVLVSAVALWIQSYNSGLRGKWNGFGHRWTWNSYRGAFILDNYLEFQDAFLREDDLRRPGGRSAFQNMPETMRFDFQYLWFVIGALGVLVLTAYSRTRRLRTVDRAGVCIHCGYDLRASPDRCPECGALSALTARKSKKSS
jgi:hypothetical protein